MRSFRRSFKVFSYEKRSQEIASKVLLLLLTVSVVLTVPPTITKATSTQQTPQISTQVIKTKAIRTALWNQTYGETGFDTGRHVLQTSDGGYIITGYTESFGAQLRDICLIKTDANGNLLWNKTYGGSNWETSYCVDQTEDGGYIAVGNTYSFGAGEADIYLIKTDENGTLLWNKTYGGPDNEWGYWVEQTTDEGYIITGATTSYGPGDGDVWLIKTNSNGDHLWNKTYGSGIDWDQGDCVHKTADGGYIITGTTVTSPAPDNYDIWLIKTNSIGDHEWNKTFGGATYEYGKCVEQTTDDGYIITGQTKSYGNPEVYDVWLIKTDENGDEVWNRTYGGTDDDSGYSIKQTSDGGYIIVGNTESYGVADSYDVWLIKTDENGDEVWNRTYGGTENDWGYCVKQTTDLGYIITGRTNSSGAGGWDIWLIKTDEAGSGAPIIDHPADITYEEATTGYNITWHPSDANPSNYTVNRNEILVDSGSWDTGNITVIVDGLSVGTYTYNCTINDTAGNWASDTVLVIVTSPQEEEDSEFPWMFLALAGTGIAVLMIVLVKKYKS